MWSVRRRSSNTRVPATVIACGAVNTAKTAIPSASRASGALAIDFLELFLGFVPTNVVAVLADP
jgi:hypothetical protein